MKSAEELEKDFKRRNQMSSQISSIMGNYDAKKENKNESVGTNDKIAWPSLTPL